MAAGTGNQIIEQKQQALKKARDYERECGSAQAGTPKGNDLVNARNAVAMAESDLNSVIAQYGGIK